MKQYYFFISTFLFSFYLSAQVVNIPDTNFKAALVGNLDINTNGDSEIQTTEAEAYNGSINLSGLGINSLEGIEAFINITGLDVTNNNLTIIDVSNNRKLTSLLISINQIASVDITNLTDLESFFASNNQISSIDVSNNTNLTVLTLGNNNLSEIDITNNLLLQTFHAYGNDIPSLDLSAHTELTYVWANNMPNLSSLNLANGNNANIGRAYIENNPMLNCIQTDSGFYPSTNVSLDWRKDLTTAYSSNCNDPNIVLVPDEKFKSYLVGNSNINTNGDTEIQISEAQAVNSEINIQGFGTVETIIGIEAFVNITSVRAGDNQISDVDLSQNTNLTRLELWQNNLTSIDLSANTQLEQLYLNDNQISTIDLSNQADLRILYLPNNSISFIELTENTELTDINLSGNPLELPPDFANFPNLSGLLLLDIDVTLDNSDFSSNPLLRELQISNNEVTFVDLSSNTNLEALVIKGTALDGIDLSLNTQLRFLDLSDNNLGYLNLANGNNANIFYAYLQGNQNLSCIQIDGGFSPPVFNASNGSGWRKDLTAAYSTNCEDANIVLIPDPNFKAYLVGNSAINTNGDSEIQISEAEAFTGTINVNNLQIETLMGIEKFISVTELIASNNNLTSVNISTLSNLTSINLNNNVSLNELNTTNNPALRIINCSFNDIESIDVSSNLNLEILSLFINSLDELDLSNNIELTHLNLSNNNSTQLASNLDLSNNTKLKNLYLGGLGLTTLDVTIFPMLESLEVWSNDLATIDLSMNPQLRSFSIYGNELMEVDLSSNPLLSFLDLGSQSTSGNIITNLDLSNKPNLEFFFGVNIGLVELNVANMNNDIIRRFQVNENPSLGCIQIDDSFTPPTYNDQTFEGWLKDDNAGYSSDCSTVVQIPDSNFRSDVVFDNAIDTNMDGLIQFSEAASYTGSINLFNQGVNELTGIEAFTNITFLDARFNNLTEVDLSNNTELQTLWLGENNISEIDLSNNTKITSLYLSNNQLTEFDSSSESSQNQSGFIMNHENYWSGYFPPIPNEEGVDSSNSNDEWFHEMSSNNETTEMRVLGVENLLNLENLWISNNQLTTLNIENNPNLVLLASSGNQLTQIDLINNPNLQFLYINDNQLTSIDVTQNNNLIELDVDGNQLTTLNVSNNQSLEFLDAGDNSLTDINVLNNTDLKILYLYRNSLTSIDLSQNPKIERLELQQNQINQSLDLSHMPNLIWVWIWDNDLTDFVKVSNGNNLNLNTFVATSNSSLRCVEIDNAFTPPDYDFSNGTGWLIDPNAQLSADCDSILGINDFNRNNYRFKIYPNPASNELNINLDEEILSVLIYDTSGKLVSSSFGANKSIDISTLPTANYIVVINTESNKFTENFIKL